MKKNVYLMFFICVFVQTKLFCQVNKDSSSFKYSINLESKLLFQNMYRVSNLEYIADIVTNEFGQNKIPQNSTITDAPLYHGAFYALLKTTSSFKNKYRLNLDLMVEDRGISYGINDFNKYLVYPIYQFQLNERLQFLNDVLSISVKAGSFINNRLHNGLKIYNIDTQGGDILLDWKNFKLQFHKVGDLSYGVGLALQEYTDFSIAYQNINSNNKWYQFGINYNLNEYSYNYYNSNYVFFNNKPYRCFGIFGEYNASKKTKYYFQYEVRNTNNSNIVEKSALLLGSKFQIQRSKLSATINAEFRYYGWLYNFRHKQDSVLYIEKEGNSLISYRPNTIGDYFYPLKNFDNPYSQWAVYTDYQYQNIAGVEIRTELEWQFQKQWNLFVNFESCSLIKEYKTFGNKLFNYYYYTLGIAYQPIKNFVVNVNLSNKVMNLDSHYQTFYMINRPIIGFSISKIFIK